MAPRTDPPAVTNPPKLPGATILPNTAKTVTTPAKPKK